jgi:hypothetical protein
MQLGISEILEKVSKFKTESEIVNALRENNCPALLTILQGAFDERIKWLLPDTDPPYKENEAHEVHNVLHSESRKMYLFIENGHNSLKQTRRETLFIEILESVHRNDAKILLAIKNKTLPYSNITKKVVNEAFPGLCA